MTTFNVIFYEDNNSVTLKKKYTFCHGICYPSNTIAVILKYKEHHSTNFLLKKIIGFKLFPLLLRITVHMLLKFEVMLCYTTTVSVLLCYTTASLLA